LFVLFTDFGLDGPYTGQMKAVLARKASQIPVIDLFADAPAWDIKASAYLLAAYAENFEEGDIFICVVDPGVGSDREWGVLKSDGRYFVGPDNGLFEIVMRRARMNEWRQGLWIPEQLSVSFHGRDIFAPVAAKIACEEDFPNKLRELEEIRRKNWTDDLGVIIYVDRYGNGITGIRASTLNKSSVLLVNDTKINYGETFSSVPKDQTFWYENSNGLVEIAANMKRADEALGLNVGVEVKIAD